MKKLTVLVVDDSKTSRDLLIHLINSDPELQVIGFATSGLEALTWLNGHTVDVITMDIMMPGLDGFQVTKRIMQTKPTPIVIVSAVYTPQDVVHGFQAIQAGALAILEKPVAYGDEECQRQTHELIDTIKTVAKVKLVRQPEVSVSSESKPIKPPIPAQEPVKAIAMGASLGGPTALIEILSSIPASLPVPIFVVQHIATGFSQGLVHWLQEKSPMRVCLAQDKEVAQPGHCYIAPAGSHMHVVKGSSIMLTHTPGDLLQPSVGQLFKSMAASYGPSAIGVILSGMGSDGARELLLMRHQGAYTIAQSQETCVMYGMPREAIALGAVQQIVPLEHIAGTLTQLVAHYQTS